MEEPARILWEELTRLCREDEEEREGALSVRVVPGGGGTLLARRAGFARLHH